MQIDLWVNFLQTFSHSTKRLDNQIIDTVFQLSVWLSKGLIIKTKNSIIKNQSIPPKELDSYPWLYWVFIKNFNCWKSSVPPEEFMFSDVLYCLEAILGHKVLDVTDGFVWFISTWVNLVWAKLRDYAISRANVLVQESQKDFHVSTVNCHGWGSGMKGQVERSREMETMETLMTEALGKIKPTVPLRITK